jgi:probable HAF family extracellular repeat protein
VVGYEDYYTGRGFLYSAGVYIELMPPGWIAAHAYGINNSGAVVGWGNATAADQTNQVTKGFLYSAGVYTELLPPGWSSVYAYGINDGGAVVGGGDDGTGTYKGFIYSDGTYTELLPPGWSYALAWSINNSGAVVGEGGDSKGVTKGFLAEPVTTTTVPTTTTTIQPTTTTTTPPTAIELSSFTVTPYMGKVLLKWATETETDNAGFNIYRAEAENGKYTKINTALIPTQGSSTQGANYEFIDSGLKNRKIYYYKLEDIDLNGTSTMHGPVSAMPRWIYG